MLIYNKNFLYGKFSNYGLFQLQVSKKSIINVQRNPAI